MQPIDILDSYHINQKRDKRFSVPPLVGNFECGQCFWDRLQWRVFECQPGIVFQASTRVKI